MEMLLGGALLLILATMTGEWTSFDVSAISTRSAAAFVYLVIFGSIIAFTAYVWLLHVSTPARVSTSAYVNPLIAVVLGCTVGHEAFSQVLLLAGGMILIAVVLVLRGGAVKPTPTSQCEEVV